LDQQLSQHFWRPLRCKDRRNPSDSSFVGYFVYPSELKNILKQWISLYPERIMFGSDAFPFNDAVGAEETFWLAAHSRKKRRSNSRAYISATMPRASTEK
jgi:predicted TIM-barrel fold metal-dependent hydrolase